MKWKKLGHVFSPDKRYDWMQTHASCPFPVHQSGDLYRIYFGSRNAKNQSSLGYIDIDITKPQNILNIAKTPILIPGTPGYFDDCGVYMPQIVEDQHRRYLYFQGWSLGTTVPFHNTIGLATAPLNSETFTKHSNVPMIDRTHDDPLFFATHWVRKEGSLWRLWYGSNQSWYQNGHDVELVIKYAESTDGIHWDRKNIICIPLNEDESAIVRCCIMVDNGLYKMWYSRRFGNNAGSSMGYAESPDGITWQRRDELAGLEIGSPGEWDSDMVCYPCVFDHNGVRYMLYNGNRYGFTGFGLAVLE